MASIGPGVWEIRVRAEGAFRIFYVTRFEEGIYVLHAFQKKSRKTSRIELAIGKDRYRAVVNPRAIG
jgi:phage-related protein